ncbi:hypothetical protein HanIR_Chr14g0677901 [Helianthus annuus]|nr:hypothetical protein HanIR_Chr14g0677901 [Helianthus annuus]
MLFIKQYILYKLILLNYLITYVLLFCIIKFLINFGMIYKRKPFSRIMTTFIKTFSLNL